MRLINLSDCNNLNATVAFENTYHEPKTEYRYRKGNQEIPVSQSRILKSTEATSINYLLRQCDGNAFTLAQKIMQSDIDVDTERVGMKLKELRTVFVDGSGNLVFNVVHREFLYNTDGTVKIEREVTETIGNMNVDDKPVSMSGKIISKNEAVHRYVFAHHYQIKPINSLTNKFLFDIAKELSELSSMMYVGAGANGDEPLVLRKGGVKYHGFLEGRVFQNSYKLLLHLTNCELRGVGGSLPLARTSLLATPSAGDAPATPPKEILWQIG